MGKISIYCITVLVFCCFLNIQLTIAKPAVNELEIIGLNPAAVSDMEISKITDEESQLKRDQRSPGFGFADYGSDYYDDGARHYKHKHKPHRPIFHGGIGCRKHGCGGSHHKPSYPSYGGGGGGGGAGSFASASAGSFNNGNHGGGGISNSQAQSASLSFGPISISTAQAQSSSRGDRYGGHGGYGGYGDYGGYDY